MSRSKKPFRERTPAEQRAIAALLVLSVAIVATAQRDLQHRPAEQVRGKKLIWRVISLNALGALGYFRWGRRTADAEVTSSR
jgi:hypothetical protein